MSFPAASRLLSDAGPFNSTALIPHRHSQVQTPEKPVFLAIDSDVCGIGVNCEKIARPWERLENWPATGNSDRRIAAFSCPPFMISPFTAQPQAPAFLAAAASACGNGGSLRFTVWYDNSDNRAYNQCFDPRDNLSQFGVGDAMNKVDVPGFPIDVTQGYTGGPPGRPTSLRWHQQW